jgi:glutathione S-transferase
MVLTHKNVSYTFRDLEPEMGKPTHLALHPFNRVPILQHGDFTVLLWCATAVAINSVQRAYRYTAAEIVRAQAAT